MSEVIKTTNGKEIVIGRQGEFQKAPESGYLPGKSYKIQGIKILSSPIDYPPSPYLTKFVLIEKSETHVHGCINGNIWANFEIVKDAEGNQIFATGLAFKPGYNDNQARVYAAFLELNNQHKAKLEQQLAAAEVKEQQLAAAAAKSLRINKIKSLRDAALADLKMALRDKDLDIVLMDTEIAEIIDRYNKFNMILKAL